MGRKWHQNQVSVNPFAVKKAAKRTKAQRRRGDRKRSSIESSDKEFSAILNQVSLPLVTESNISLSGGKELVPVKPMPKTEAVSGSAIVEITQRTQRTELN